MPADTKNNININIDIPVNIDTHNLKKSIKKGFKKQDKDITINTLKKERRKPPCR